MGQIQYGSMTCHGIGIIMKEIVRRMMEDIRRHLFVFEVTPKLASDGTMTDVVTNIDKQAQAICIKWLRECFPHCGIIAEENNVCLTCTDASLGDMHFTIDPIDGTKAFVRQQSHGIGTMISLVHEGRISAAYVGDVMTQEIYGYRPESDAVHRISQYGVGRQLTIDPELTLASQCMLLRNSPREYSPFMYRLIKQGARKGLFKSYEITGGSIGISTARLWKSEVGATVLRANRSTPWDMDPIMGICQKLGFSCFTPNAEQTHLVPYKHTPDITVTNAPDLFIVHHSRAMEIAAWQRHHFGG